MENYMKTTTINCPKCGGDKPWQDTGDKEKYKCKFCNKEFLLKNGKNTTHKQEPPKKLVKRLAWRAGKILLNILWFIVVALFIILVANIITMIVQIKF